MERQVDHAVGHGPRAEAKNTGWATRAGTISA
jgi:hypothetical protein